MSEQEKQENQKTIVAFAAGLLIGGLLVWVFGGAPKSEAPKDTAEEQNTTEVINSNDIAESDEDASDDNAMQTGDGKIVVANQKAGTTVVLDSAVFPADEGWIGVRDYANGQPAGVLGAARYSKAQGLVPSAVALQRATVAGKDYALVFYSESGDRVFSLADDKQIGAVVATFKAN